MDRAPSPSPHPPRLVSWSGRVPKRRTLAWPCTVISNSGVVPAGSRNRPSLPAGDCSRARRIYVYHAAARNCEPVLTRSHGSFAGKEGLCLPFRGEREGQGSGGESVELDVFGDKTMALVESNDRYIRNLHSSKKKKQNGYRERGKAAVSPSGVRVFFFKMCL